MDNNNTQEWKLNYMKRVRQVLSLVNDRIRRPFDVIEEYDALEYEPKGWARIDDKWYSFVVRFEMGETARKGRNDVSLAQVVWTFYRVDRSTEEQEEVLTNIILPEWKWDDVMWDANMLFTLMGKVIEDGKAYLTRAHDYLPTPPSSPLGQAEEKLRSFVEAYKSLSKEGQRIFLEDNRHTLTVHPLDFKMWSGEAHEIEEYLRSIGHDGLHVWDSDSERFSEFVTRTNVDLQVSAEVLGYHCFKDVDAVTCLGDALVDLFHQGPEKVRDELFENGFMLWHKEDGNIQDMVDHYMIDVQVWNWHSEHVGEFLRRCEFSIVEVFDHMDTEDYHLWGTDERIGDFLDRAIYNEDIRLSEVATWIALKLEEL